MRFDSFALWHRNIKESFITRRNEDITQSICLLFRMALNPEETRAAGENARRNEPLSTERTSDRYFYPLCTRGKPSSALEASKPLTYSTEDIYEQQALHKRLKGKFFSDGIYKKDHLLSTF